TWARASSQVTSTDQRMTTHAKICPGVACRSVPKNASIRSFLSGSHTMTKRIATGGNLGVYHKAVREKTQSVLSWPPYQATSTVSQGVSRRSAHACRRSCRGPFVGLGPCLPGGRGPGG